MQKHVPTNQPGETDVNRIILCIAFALFAGSSSAGVIRESANIEYTPPKPEFTMSDEIPPWEEVEWRGIHWVNDSHVPCTIILYVDTPIFWVACAGMDSVQRNLQDFAFGKPITLRYVGR